jgi:hypothetical protein
MNNSFGIQNFRQNALVTPTQSLQSLPESSLFWNGNRGIDTVRIGFPINLEHLSLHDPVWKVHASIDQKNDKETEWLDHNLWIGHANVHLIVRPLYGVASLEFKAPAIRNQECLYLLEPSQLTSVVEEVLVGVSHLIYPAFDHIDLESGEITRDPLWRSMVKFQRLDLAQNLLIPSQVELAQVKAAIAKVNPSHMRKKESIESTKGGWTVYNKTSRSGLERIYDKHAETAKHQAIEPAPPGTLRFEAQLQGKRLKEPIYVKSLDQLTNESAWKALENRWKACKWAVPIMEGKSIYKAISAETEAVQDGILGFMLKMADGLSGQMDPRRLQTMTKKAQSLGLVPGLPLESQGLVTKVLDLKEGGLVAVQ